MKIKPIFIIICGGSGSGKTTVANMIKDNLPHGYTCRVVSFDNFYLSKDKITTDNYDSPEAIDWFAAREAANLLVEQSRSYKMPVYNFKKQKIDKYTEIPPSDVIIFEGILSLYNDQIRNLADIKIFVDVPDDERLIRRILRDQKTRGTDILSTVTTWRNSVIKMHQKYVEPMRYISDMIIPWAENNIVPIKAISGALEYMIYSNKRTRNSKASKK